MNYIKISMEQINVILKALGVKDNEGLLDDNDYDFIYDLYCKAQGTQLEDEMYINYDWFLNERINVNDVVKIKKYHLKGYRQFKCWVKRSYEHLLKDKPIWEYLIIDKYENNQSENLNPLMKLQKSLYYETKELNDKQFEDIKISLIERIKQFIEINYVFLPFTENQIKAINGYIEFLFTTVLTKSTKEALKDNLTIIVNEGTENYNINMIIHDIRKKMKLQNHQYYIEKIYNIVLESIKNKIEEINQEV